MANEDKKTVSDSALSRTPKVATVTWFRTHEALMNPGLDSMTSYMQGNVNMHGTRKFFWTVGTDYLFTTLPNGEMAVCPCVNFVSFSVKL